MIVVDASVAVKWLLAESGSAAAIALLRGRRSELAAPDLLLVEAAGAVVRRVNDRTLSREDGAATLERWWVGANSGDVIFHRADAGLLRRAAVTAIGLGHPLKDCVYLALAIELGCELVTCDAKFRDRAADAYPRVRHLNEYAS